MYLRIGSCIVLYCTVLYCTVLYCYCTTTTTTTNFSDVTKNVQSYKDIRQVVKLLFLGVHTCDTGAGNNRNNRTMEQINEWTREQTNMIKLLYIVTSACDTLHCGTCVHSVQVHLT